MLSQPLSLRLRVDLFPDGLLERASPRCRARDRWRRGRTRRTERARRRHCLAIDLLDRPFDIGDFIIVDDYMGSVQEVRWRTTRAKSLGGEQIIFPNADLARSRIRNYKRMQERRVVFEIGIEYNLSPDLVRRAAPLLREIVEATPEVRFDRAHFKGFGDFALLYEVEYYVLSPDYNEFMDRQQSINLAIYERFTREGIPFAFPSRTVYMRESSQQRTKATPIPT